MIDLVKDSEKMLFKWYPFDDTPPKTCKIIAITHDGKVSSGSYSKKDNKYTLDFGGHSVKYWSPLPDNLQDYISFRNDTCQVVAISAPEDGELLATMGGFGMFVNYNFSKMKSNGDVERAADAFGQYFYEHAIDTLSDVVE